jgi:hypothetical protein
VGSYVSFFVGPYCRLALIGIGRALSLNPNPAYVINNAKLSGTGTYLLATCSSRYTYTPLLLSDGLGPHGHTAPYRQRVSILGSVNVSYLRVLAPLHTDPKSPTGFRARDSTHGPARLAYQGTIGQAKGKYSMLTLLQ